MGAFGLKAGKSYRKQFMLAVAALLLVLITLLPASPASAATPTPNVATPTPASPTEAVASPTPATPTAITIQKESNQWWIVYPPDGNKVKFEDVADYVISDNPEAPFDLIVVDNNDNVLPIEFDEASAYMRHRGLWQTANKDEAEKSFWDSVTGFLSDIWDGIKSIGQHVAFFFESLITGQFLTYLIIACLKSLGAGCSEVILNCINLADSTEVLFQTPVGRILVAFASNFGLMLWIIGFIIATAEIVINHKSNRLMSDTLHDYILNIFKSFVAVLFFVKVPVPLYALITDIAVKICKPIIDLGYNTMVSIYDFNFNNLTFDFTQSDLMLLIFFIAILFAGLKVLFSFIKRGGILMILILVGSVHMINTPRGYWDAFWSWCRQIIALCITQFCQMALFCAGIAMFMSTVLVSFGIFLAAISLMLAAAEVPRIADRYGIDTSFKNNAATAVQTAATAVRLVTVKH